MKKDKFALGETGIYNARELGVPRMLILGLQHMFAMFGATVLVPIITGLSVSTTLLMAGLGTLLFHLLTKGKVPAFLGSSFAFLGGYAAVSRVVEQPDGTKAVDPALLPYACLGVACAGLLYFILAGLIRLYGPGKVMRFFPPVVIGPIIIAIGLNLSPSAIDNCKTGWIPAIVAVLVVVVLNIWGRGMLKIIPILCGIVISYIVALCMGDVIFQPVLDADWVGIPVVWGQTVFGGVDWSNSSLIISSIIAIVPIALATMMEHIGDISAISATTGRNYIKDPGLHRTLVGDGLATALASLFGGPANTTYGENTGVLELTKVFDPRVIRIAAYFAIFFSFSPKFAALIGTIPPSTIGGISLVLYGMISAIGVRNVVESKVDFKKSRNVITAGLILVLALGLGSGITFTVGSASITLTSLAVAAIVGIVVNAVLPGKDYKFDEEKPEPNGANLNG